MAKKILIIEDDMHIRELIKYNLQAVGFEVEDAESGKEGLKKIGDFLPDLILLDIMLPEMSGIDVLKYMRKDAATLAIPVILLTAKGSEMDKIVGLESGADDYITKPFSVSELMARVKAHLRRTDRGQTEVASSGPAKVISFGPYTMDLEKYLVMKDKEEIKLSLKEFDLLKILLEHRGKVLTRDQLLDEVWGYDYYGETRTVDVHIRHLRKKLDPDNALDLINTVRGVGYKVK